MLKIILLPLLFFFYLVPVCQAADDEYSNMGTLRIGTLHSPPFCIKNSDGSWSGISIELWRLIAADLQIAYKFEERTIPDLLTGVTSGELDAAIAALTITEDREEFIDFSHPFHTTGFAIATLPSKQNNVWLSVFQQLFTWQFFQVVGLLILMLLFVGWIMWLVEHKHEPAHEDSHTIRHISEGFWWAAATMTTVGYGDKTPLTRVGRALGVIWMFTALMLVASFIAAFSSILTVHKLNTSLQSPKDLVNTRVATVPGSTSELYLKRKDIVTRTYPTVRLALASVASGETGAMVYDAPLIRYLARTEFKDQVEVLSVVFERQDYGFALTTDSWLREPVNRKLLRIIRSEEWNETLARYLGSEE